jgi:choline dehydrogenase-like flavoprotein
MDNIMIIGSGASGVHFALSVLRKGYEVTMLDVGKERPEVVNPEDSFIDLKNNLKDPVKYFLGNDYEAVIYPDFKSEYYGFPPSKNYVFSEISKFDFASDGFTPLFSFAQGGLAETWTGGAYPFNDDDLDAFPFGYEDIEPYYNEVARRIGIAGMNDDLERFYPFHKSIMQPLELDQHSGLLLSRYEKNKDYFNNELRCYIGRARVATLSMDKDGRKGCTYEGRCLWGCPTDALYTARITLNECKRYPNFKYVPDVYVNYFKFNSKRHVTDVVAESLHTNESFEFPVERLVLAAGTLCSSKIFMNSLFQDSGKITKLHGLMDNRQILMPFINYRMIGKPYNPESYQYHQIVMMLEGERTAENIHGLVTTLKTALTHPIVQNMPLDLKTSLFVFRNIHAALGIVNINRHDTRREESGLSLEGNQGKSHTRLLINYSPVANEKASIKQAVKKVASVLRKLGCIVPLSMSHIRPMGSSVHYTGTIPMSSKETALTTSRYCQSHDFENLYIVDGTTFPSLPAKNLTFTLMANAVRVAENVF